MITLTVSQDRICLFDWKKEKLFRASLNEENQKKGLFKTESLVSVILPLVNVTVFFAFIHKLSLDCTVGKLHLECGTRTFYVKITEETGLTKLEPKELSPRQTLKIFHLTQGFKSCNVRCSHGNKRWFTMHCFRQGSEITEQHSSAFAMPSEEKLDFSSQKRTIDSSIAAPVTCYCLVL